MDGGPFWLVSRLWMQHRGVTCHEHGDGRCHWWYCDPDLHLDVMLSTISEPFEQ